MAEPISDDELQRLRELWKYLQGFDPDYRISERVGPLLRLLARLDAAESLERRIMAGIPGVPLTCLGSWHENQDTLNAALFGKGKRRKRAVERLWKWRATIEGVPESSPHSL